MSDFPKIRRFDRKSLGLPNKIPVSTFGKVLDISGDVLRVHLPECRMGSLVEIFDEDDRATLAEVIAINRQREAVIMPYGELNQISLAARISLSPRPSQIYVSEDLKGRIIDPFMQPLDGLPLSRMTKGKFVMIDKGAPNPIKRTRINRPMSLGVRAIDGLLTFGEGQRVGIMAGSGVGKSVLLGMISRSAEADINVIALIGERGREVREFIEKDLGPEGLARSVVIVVTGDKTPLMRIRAAKVATAVAEYFSMEGKKVLLMLDSLTRVAQAQREVGLSSGEPPTTKAYPPSVFTMLPRLLERCGPQEAPHGSISAIYTVLVDGDDFNDPIADAARSILDGHIVLSRQLASLGHFPAIDISQSASRVMHDIVEKHHWQKSVYLKSLISAYQESLLLIQTGTYQNTDPHLNHAIQLKPRLDEFLKQDMFERSDFDAVQIWMRELLSVEESNAQKA